MKLKIRISFNIIVIINNLFGIKHAITQTFYKIHIYIYLHIVILQKLIYNEFTN